jgi:hypothetical protein
MSELLKQAAEFAKFINENPTSQINSTGESQFIARPVNLSPAESTYNRLRKYIADFEANLDDEHEIGARLVSFGQTLQFHIESLGYHGPDIITFEGVDKGQRVQLIQNISQLNVLLVAVKKIGENARRIGFV